MLNISRTVGAPLMRTFALGLLAVAACNADPVEPNDKYDGFYALTAVDGVSLPVTISGSGDNRTDISGGRITIHANTIGYRVDRTTVQNGVESTTVELLGGTYTFDGQNLNMTVTATGETIVIRYQGTKLERIHEGRQYDFRK